MTKKLFWEDPYLTECSAKAIEINGKKTKLNQTIFYAFSGGQQSDKGTIGGITVINAVKKGDREDIIDIEYGLEKEPDFDVGDEVIVKIDKQRRSRLRRLHSAAHIFYYFFIEKFGKQKIIGSNISEKKARVDFLFDHSLTDKLFALEKDINNFLKEGHEIITKPDSKKPDLRWWHCENWKMPCGGTHVKNTKEIGKIKLKRKNIGKGKERIEIYLGD
ncbi:alanyl-tRNA editing protein [Candidatus Woesearchaeota archaeon]|nr:alanyl-tRNA editing protein [Candidatus Woesearchaeota archaeon]